MADKPNSTGKETPPQEQFAIQNVYVKDISFEAPNTPQIFLQTWKPQLSVEMSNEINKLDENNYEVILNITATVQVEDKTAFLVEIHQAGIFSLVGFSSEKLSYMLNSFCPNILFPYAREAISSMVTRGGFHPLVLAPVNFDAMYAHKLNQNKAQQQKDKGQQAN